MSQEKKECSRTTSSILSKDIMSVISFHLKDEKSKSALLSSHLGFGVSSFQRNRILTKLAQLACQGNIAQIAKLEEIRPDLGKEVVFTLAGLGAQNEMESILRKHPEYLLNYAPLRDISGARFERITLFQHALWAKDVRYMAHMMLDCLPKTEKGEEIRLKLIRQYEELMSQGVVYHLGGVRHKECHFNLNPLITALDTYETDNVFMSDEEKAAFWCTTIGGAQSIVPAHIRHHYCDPELTISEDEWYTKPKLKRSLAFNYKCGFQKIQLWSEAMTGLGRDFGMGLGMEWGPGLTLSANRVGLLSPEEDFFASRKLLDLDETRTQIDLPKLVERLQISVYKQEEKIGVQKFGL